MSNYRNKFVVHKCSDHYCKTCSMCLNEHKFGEYTVFAYVYDANEEFLPDWTPDWLNKIIRRCAKESNGDQFEFMESLLQMDENCYNALINHPDCVNHDIINSEKEEENIDSWREE